MQTLHLCLHGVTRLLSPPPSPLHMLPSSHMGLLPNLTFQHTRCCLRAFACAVVDFAWFLSPPWIQPQPSKAWDGHTGSSRPPPLGPFSFSFRFFQKPRDSPNAYDVFVRVSDQAQHSACSMYLRGYLWACKRASMQGARLLPRSSNMWGRAPGPLTGCPVPTRPAGFRCNLRSHYPDGLGSHPNLTMLLRFCKMGVMIGTSPSHRQRIK